MKAFYENLQKLLKEHNVSITASHTGSYAKVGFQLCGKRPIILSRSYYDAYEIGLLLKTAEPKTSLTYTFAKKRYITVDNKPISWEPQNIMQDANGKVFAFEGVVIVNKGELFSPEEFRVVMLKEVDDGKS